MSDPQITFAFDDHTGLYLPGDIMSGEYRVDTASPQEVRALEVSVLWHTLGKGDEDLAVHYFQRESDDESLVDLRAPRRFATRLPNSPLTYDGIILKICWCVRVRVFLRRGREVVAEQPFRLGFVPPPQVQLRSEPVEEMAE